MIISIGSTTVSRQSIRDFILQQKQINPLYRVIDLGGIAVSGSADFSGIYSWTNDIVDFVVDINAPPNRSDCMAIDLCDQNQLNQLEHYISQHGQFDYAICTHTLEDLYNPIAALSMLPKIARAGVVTMPSAQTELSHVESEYWLGYMHHRWIFDKTDDDQMLIAPKFSWIERRYDRRFHHLIEKSEIKYEWQTELPFTVLMNNYYGPNAISVLNAFDIMIGNIEERQNGK